MGFGGGAVLITAAASSAYYTATLLSGLQGPDQKTYLDIANRCLEGGRHHREWLIIVFQLLVMFPTSCVMILLGGEAMQTIDLMVEGAAVSYSECGGYKFDCSCEKNKQTSLDNYYGKYRFGAEHDEGYGRSLANFCTRDYLSVRHSTILYCWVNHCSC